ncbi:RNA-splicing ligase RtcB [Rhodobacteraceae bacterium CYK-10]|uniref:3'-phosphate/5'-hydroxy nucleic acid ligase n=2 Tax=Stagnihabitans tardus TaxID=2699202 RepID=A0AAE4YCZ8_9RHOB|nr:RNA-splicing ligase RtcB [Stagnihabitans tardus]
MTDDKHSPITGADLIAWGHRPGRQFPTLLAEAAQALAEGADRDTIRARLERLIPAPLAHLSLQDEGAVPLHVNLTASDPDEEANLQAVLATMRDVLRTPTVTAGAILPDACPAGPLGTIPVGGVVAARNAIHPGMHSADICCSVMLTDLGEVDPKAALDAAQAITHFGPGGRGPDERLPVDPELLDAFRANPFLSGAKMLHLAQSHMGTQGDGNHFLFIGRSAASGRVAMVTHHGSRGPGGLLYKAGMEVAEGFRKRLSPVTLKQNAWIPADTEEGLAYWEALQILRRWTKANHDALHQAVADRVGAAPGARFWNEHNFVFKRGDIYLHGKGATPAWTDYAEDATGLTLVPLNMAEPVLVVKGRDASHALGFSPHGAGRNWSRTEHRRRLGALTPDQALAAETQGLDIRFHAGGVDASELPSSYKPAATLVRQIGEHGLAEVVDRIEPHGCIMAGDIPPFWEAKRSRR